MNGVSTADVVIYVCIFAAGWASCRIWESFLDWLYDVTGWAGGFLWDVLAIVGIGAVCVGAAAVIT